jgi:glucose/arabinose dehydrogenase
MHSRLPLSPWAVLPLLAAPSFGQATVELISTVGGRPVAVTSPAGETTRLFVALKTGSVTLIKDGAYAGKFLDWAPNMSDAGEGGLLGLAFHPDYANNGKFYVSYTGPLDGNSDSQSYISQFQVSADPDLADPTSEQVIWTGPYYTMSHRAGDLHFGPDGKLYFSIGDGGTTTDGSLAQDLTDARGSILRFDIDIPFPHIPADNPFVGDPNALDEIWAYGFRNPFRFGIDPLNGDLFVGDVGSSIFEEVTAIPAGQGGVNAGWPCVEGTQCSGSPFCDCQGALLPPIHAYDHSVGCSVISGTVYRGSQIPSLYGKYFFADFCQSKIWSLRWDGNQVTDFEDHTAAFQAGLGADNSNMAGFGADGAGELYIVNHYNTRLWKIVPDCFATNYCQATNNSTGSPGVITASGSFSVSVNDLTLTSSQLPQNKFGYFLNSMDQAFIQNPGGSQGNLCVGGAIGRHVDDVGNTGSSGTLVLQPDLSALPRPNGTAAVQAGETWHFTLWHRDKNPDQTSNFTDGVSVLFCP